MARGKSFLHDSLLLHKVAQARNGILASELAVDLDVHRRTVYNILDRLQAQGQPLYQDEVSRRWKLKDGQLPPLRFDPAEAVALLWAQRAVNPGLRRTPLAGSLDSAIAKVRTLLTGGIADKLHDFASTHATLPGPYHNYAGRDREIASLRRAIGDKKAIFLDYRGPHPGQRKVDPYALVESGGALYLVGYCHRRKDFRTFLIDRIAAVTPQMPPEHFQPEPTFDPAHYFDGAFGVYRGKPETVRLKFARPIARWASERCWPGQKELVQNMDGSATLTLHIAPTPDLVAHILACGARVQVLSPKKLATRVAREHFVAAGRATRDLETGAAAREGPRQRKAPVRFGRKGLALAR